jgi:predicted acyl esterase
MSAARMLTVAGVLAALLIGPAAAQGDVKPFGTIDCTPLDGVRFCEGKLSPPTTDQRIKSFPPDNNVPLDVNVALPASGDTNLPLVVILHGWGGSKVGKNADGHIPELAGWAQRGYAVLSYTARGFNGSCGRPDNRLMNPMDCSKGWIHLADDRFEVRDTQYLTGLLADQGIVDPQRIGVTGPSYAGGQSMALAVLKDRIMNSDGSLSPWTSPGGKPMRIAGAVPVIPWTDLAYALEPNGRTLDYTITSQTDDFTPIGVEKRSFVSALYGLGNATGYYSPPGADPNSDLTSWFARVNAGEPSDSTAQDIVKQITTYHSSYYLDRSESPAPLLIANGFTDDLFPADEAIRFYNRSRVEHPDAPISLMFFDFGHMRGTGKAADEARLDQRRFEWFDRYVKGDQSASTLNGVETLTQTCPKDAPSGGPFDTPDWASQHPGEVRFLSAGAQTLMSGGGDPSINRAVDPVAGGGDACASTPAGDQAGTATYRLPKAAGAGYTLMGAPTVIADLKVTSPSGAENTQVAARLWDVAADSSSQTLVGRALYRPTGDGRQVFQLHPNGWRFAPGHTAKLELLGNDDPYGRTSNDAFSIAVSNLDFRLPVREHAGGQVTAPAPPFIPGGARPTPAAAKAANCQSTRKHKRKAKAKGRHHAKHKGKAGAAKAKKHKHKRKHHKPKSNCAKKAKKKAKKHKRAHHRRR